MRIDDDGVAISACPIRVYLPSPDLSFFGPTLAPLWPHFGPFSRLFKRNQAHNHSICKGLQKGLKLVGQWVNLGKGQAYG